MHIAQWLPRSRLGFLPGGLVLLVILSAYFFWFDAYTHTRHSAIVAEDAETPENTPRILIVSALFPLGHAKHSHADYTRWLTHFLGPGAVHGADIYFYTTPALASLVRAVNANTSTTSSRLTINTAFDSPLSIPPLAPYEAKYEAMHAWDRERARHSPALYAVWNAKPWLVVEALRVLREARPSVDYDYVFWSDAGAFRRVHAYRAWPDPARVQEVFRDAHDKVLFPLYMLPSRKEYSWIPEKGPVDTEEDFVQGSFFGSSPKGVTWFADTFYALHDHYISTAPPTLPPTHHPHAPAPASNTSTSTSTTPPFHFVGKDQTLFNALLFRHPTHFLGVLAPLRTGLLPPSTTTTTPTAKVPYALTPAYGLARARAALARTLGVGACGDGWYYYQWWLAAGAERRATRDVRGGWAQTWWGCEQTPVLDVERVLRGLYGGRWVEGRKAEAG
ncbi:hypothetical protein H0H81_002433 [Sphagnurus paluster]|uniref:Uncharacterized protein n=1 Tax=Sphagnurus paluster TaxID=117069 RepID=A0A9P7K1I4_9AGAR|nr:hypothetical protein H0H81_002433 [Sphagnurus paluster]